MDPPHIHSLLPQKGIIRSLYPIKIITCHTDGLPPPGLSSLSLLCYSPPYSLGTRSLTVLVRVSIAVMKHHDPRNLGRDGFIQ